MYGYYGKIKQITELACEVSSGNFDDIDSSKCHSTVKVFDKNGNIIEIRSNGPHGNTRYDLQYEKGQRSKYVMYKDDVLSRRGYFVYKNANTIEEHISIIEPAQTSTIIYITDKNGRIEKLIRSENDYDEYEYTDQNIIRTNYNTNNPALIFVGEAIGARDKVKNTTESQIFEVRPNSPITRTWRSYLYY